MEDKDDSDVEAELIKLCDRYAFIFCFLIFANLVLFVSRYKNGAHFAERDEWRNWLSGSHRCRVVPRNVFDLHCISVVDD